MDTQNSTCNENESRDNTELEGTYNDLKATNLGTIVVRGGPVQMVIALLQSPNAFHVKVVEVEPKLTYLGENIDEAVSIQKEHDDLLRQLQGMPTPVDEFIKKADKLLTDKKVDSHVLDAMGHTLNVIWDDILKLLFDRKHLLDLCVDFHEKMGSCRGKMASLEVACKDTMIPIEVEAVQEFLNKFKQLRIDVLTSVMSALKEGNELLAKLQEVSKSGTLDSRPGHIKRDAVRAINQVQQWLENLHDRRNLLEAAWQTRKGQLEQCLALAILAKDLSELENTLMNQRNNLSDIFSLGECEHTSNNKLQEYIGFKHDALLLRDRTLKITRATEKIISSSAFAGDEACSKAYNVLSNCTEYLELIDQRVHWLQQSKEFFGKAEKTLLVFERLEIELASIKTPTNAPEAFAFFSKILTDVKIFTEESLRLGYAILDDVGRTKPETQGVKRVLDEIENRKVYIEGICSTNTEAQVRVTEALNNFLEEYNQLLSWLVSIAEAFLKTNNAMGTNLQQAKDFLHLHHQLMQDLEVKGENINNLLKNIKRFLELLDAQQRYDVDTKAESLHKHWIELKELIVKRVDLAAIHIEFLEKAQSLNILFEDMERTLNETPRGNKLKFLENNWAEIKLIYGNLKATGIRFLNIKVADPYLETKSVCTSVEEILNNFSNRQYDIASSWKEWTTKVEERQEIEILLEKILGENIEALNETTKFDIRLYPVITSDSENPTILKKEINDKLNEFLNDIEKEQNEILQKIEIASKIQTKDEELLQKTEQVKSNLKSLRSSLDNTKQDYRLFLENILHFLENIISVHASVDQYFAQTQFLATVSEEEHDNLRILSDHDRFRESSMDNFRTLISQSEKLIERVRTLEPEQVRERDIDRILKLLENLRIHFERNNEQKMAELKKLQINTDFKTELGEIKNNLESVKKQLDEIRAQNPETLTSAKTSSLAFEYFERTIELLEKRIGNFKKSSEDTHIATNPELELYARAELDKLNTEWSNFRKQVKLTRDKLNSTTYYFEIYEKINSKYRETSAFYASITNKIPFLRNSVDASNLINDVEKYVSANQPLQMQNIEKLLKLSNNIKDQEKTIIAKDDNIALFESFSKLKSDINDVEFRNEIEKQQEIKNGKNETDDVEEIHTKTVVSEICTEIKYIRPQFTQRLQDETIKEGDKVVFACTVVGDPVPTIEWFKDGISIQNNTDYHTSYSKGECTLCIDETFTADSARFMCIASNLVGSDETAATLTVKEHSINEQMIPPKIIKYLQDGIAREGSSFQFSCTITGNPLPTVQWFKDNICIDDSPDYVILYNNGEAILRFDEVFLEDHAIYTCKVSNPAGFEQCSAKLTVEPLEPTEIPSFILPLSNVMARVGQKIKLECQVAGIPRPEIYWTHNSKPLYGRDTKYEGDRVTLIISEAYLKDAGLYVVNAKNLAGEAYSSCNVSVKGRLPNETSDSEVASDMEPIKPTVQIPLKDISVFEGKSVRLDCIIVGQPEPEVIWYHDNRPVKESADVQLLFQGDRCSLIIQEAYLEDAGLYKVVAINSAGETSSNCALNVTPLNISEPAIRHQNEKLTSTELPPKFEKFLTDVLAAEGDTIELECVVTGNGPFTAKWYLANKELLATNHIKMVSHDNGTFKLLINNVTIDDKGVYTVKVSNKYGDAKCFSHLIVKSVNVQETQKSQKEIGEQYAGPTFKELFSDQNARCGDTVKFECMVLGKPTPKVKWLFNGQAVHGKHFLISTSVNRQVLTIPSASIETVGKIACVAENEIGKATCAANLNLIAEDSPSVDIQSITEEHNTESSKVTFRKQMFTTNSTSQVSTTEQPSEKLENKISQISEISEINKIKDIESPTRTTRKSIAPKFVNPLVGKIVDQGANVILEAVYDGFPSPEIKVQKNGDDLFDTDRIKITNKFNKVLIDLSNVGVRDAGRYSITASNQAGASTSTADVVVKKTIFPPVFGHRLQAQVAKRGERVVMEIEVTGTPIPIVTWHKDNKPLKDVLTSNYKIKSDGNIHTLVIEKVQTQDSGKYMVKAINDGGESQSIADFAVLEPTPERMIEVVKTTVYDDLKDFKEETFKPAEQSFHTKQIESKIESDSHVTAESKVVTEHRCVTEATMRLEHKPNYLDLPTLNIPATKQKLSEVQQITSTMSTETKRTLPYIPVVSSADNVIETSISKQSAFEYFKKIQDEPTVKIETKYMKFDDSKKPEPRPKLTSLHQEHSLNAQLASEKLTEDVNILNQFNIKPGSPPQIGFIPKPEYPSKMQISQKIKKLEESQKCFTEPPAGGVSVLPQIIKREDFSKSSFSKEKDTFKTESVFSAHQPAFEKAQSPKPSAEGVAMEKLWTSPKSFEKEPAFKADSQSFEPDYKRCVSASESGTGIISPEEFQNIQSIKETKEIFERKILEQQSKLWTSSQSPPELKSPNLVKQSLPVSDYPKTSPTPIIDVQLQPGTPPEICFAPPPIQEKKQSFKVDIERNFEKTLLKEPSKVIPCSVKTLPPAKQEITIPTIKTFPEQQPYVEVKAPIYSSPPFSSKFVKGEFNECEKIRLSKNESHQLGFMPVKPSVVSYPKAIGSVSLPASQFQKFQTDKKVKSKLGNVHNANETINQNFEQQDLQKSKNFFELKQTNQQYPIPQFKSHLQSQKQNFDTSSLTKNISMTTKQIKINEELAADTAIKVPSPSKFVKSEFHESDHSSDYDDKIRSIWKPYGDSSIETKGYRPVRPSLTPTRISNFSEGSKSPIPPSEFDHIPKFDGPPRPKFKPVKKEEPIKGQTQSHVFKPKPVSAKYVEKKIPSYQPSYTTRYYTAVAGAPLHHASLATETKNTMQMKESTETCQRVLNLSQTKRIIHFDNHTENQENFPELSSFCSSPISNSSSKPRVHPPSTPTKFIPGEYRESDYESEIENSRIRPLWTPNPSDIEEPKYRHVNPPRPTRAASLPRSYERIISPLEFDINPVEMLRSTPSYTSQNLQTTDDYRSYNLRSRDDMNLKVGSPPKYGYASEKISTQAKDLGHTFRKRTSRFMEDVSKDLKITPTVFRPGFKRAPSEGSNHPQIYRDESRISQYGTKHIDPNTGLIYFKYDFGYEFGIIFPGEGKSIVRRSGHPSINQNEQMKHPIKSEYSRDIVIPVQHERTTPNSFKSQNGFTSDCEFSETEYETHAKKRYSMPVEIRIDDFHKEDRNFSHPGKDSIPVNAHLNRENRLKKSPLFITPLKDIAVVSGQTARFECIVQAEPYPEIVWSKNGFPIHADTKYVIEFRNGVCRLTITEASPVDAGTYTCTGKNQLGFASTSAELLVPGNRCGIRH